jgi:hypothetical protein
MCLARAADAIRLVLLLFEILDTAFQKLDRFLTKNGSFSICAIAVQQLTTNQRRRRSVLRGEPEHIVLLFAASFGKPLRIQGRQGS